MNRFKDIVSQAARLMVCALGLAAVLGYVDSRWLEPHRTPPCRQELLPEGRVCLSHVLKTWKPDQIVWIDARNQDAFERGTIKAGQVLSIRNDEMAAELLLEALPVLHQAGVEGKVVVVFCDRSCDAASAVAEMLGEFQLQTPVFVLEGGWEEIRKVPSLVP